MTRNGELHFCWRPLFLLRCLWNKVPSQRRLTAPVRPSPQVSLSWKCISASVEPSEIKYHPCAKRLVIFPLQLWLHGGRSGQVLLGFFEMVLYFTNTGIATYYNGWVQHFTMICMIFTCILQYISCKSRVKYIRLQCTSCNVIVNYIILQCPSCNIIVQFNILQYTVL